MYAVTVPFVSAPYPGQPQWPDNRPRQPERPPPIQFRQEEPGPAPNKALQWTLRIAGLVVVAVVSGLAWYYVTDDTSSNQTENTSDETPPRSEGVYQFIEHEDVPKPRQDDNCAEHAYDDIKRFFDESPCVSLTRALYVTKVPDGRTVYTSVAVVRMPDEQGAARLRELVDTDETGNVNDLVREGVVTIEGLKSLSRGGGYKSKQTGSEVVIVESDFDPKAQKGDSDEDVLDHVCEDALLLGSDLSAG